ncbi:hypothetical protein ACLX1H_000854 [Fusarium chlamydosporum]
MDSQSRAEHCKKELLEAGKKAQKDKDEAKENFEKDTTKEKGQRFQEWVEMNDPALIISYQKYESQSTAYAAALQTHNASEAKEWQTKQLQAYKDKKLGDDEFEKVFTIILPED